MVDQPALTRLGFTTTPVPTVHVEEDVTEKYLGVNSPYLGGRVGKMH